jgi:hypothetical protein
MSGMTDAKSGLSCRTKFGTDLEVIDLFFHLFFFLSFVLNARQHP